jgi:hypothetical protein
VPGLGTDRDAAGGVALDLGADDAEDPAPDNPGVVAVQAAQPQPGEVRLGALAFLGHGDVLAVAGGPAGRGEQHRRFLGELVGPPVHLRGDVRLQVLIRRERDSLLELPEAADGAEAVTPAELGIGVGLQDLAQQVLLGLDRGAAERVEVPQ